MAIEQTHVAERSLAFAWRGTTRAPTRSLMAAAPAQAASALPP